MCVMFKRVFVLMACLVMLSSSAVMAENVRNFSEDVKIQSALEMLDDIGAEEIFNNLRENSVKIMFYDLSQIAFKHANHFAMNTTDTWGNRYILINSKFKNAPTEQIACLIAHESCHKANKATLAEETLATRTGNCCDQTNLLVALCRASGIPVKYAHGRDTYFYYSGKTYAGHVWAQILIGDIWYAADTTGSQNSLGFIKNWRVEKFGTLSQYVLIPF